MPVKLNKFQKITLTSAFMNLGQRIPEFTDDKGNIQVVDVLKIIEQTVESAGVTVRFDMSLIKEGMVIEQIADIVCQELGLTEQESIAVIGFLSAFSAAKIPK